jgi:alcohol dehydrogenase (cytochrome c)
MANRNAFYYVLDRATGEFITGAPYARQNWAEGLDSKGRPILKPDMEPNEKGVLVYPHWAGAANWHSPSYSPVTQLFYQNVREMGSTFFKGSGEYVAGKMYEGGSFKPVDVEGEAYGAVRALEGTSGKLKWEFRIPTPPLAGVLSTAGGLVFSGTNEGNFFALDADNGKPLWDFNVGGGVRANPISYAIDGKQFVGISAGAAFFVFALP